MPRKRTGSPVPEAHRQAPRPRGRVFSSTGADYSEEELAFVQALDRYKRERRRPFPAWSEVLAVTLALGYRKVAEPGPLPEPPPDEG